MLLKPIDHEFMTALKRLIARGEPVGRLCESAREWVLPACWNGLRQKYMAALRVCALLAPRGVHLSIIRRVVGREPFGSRETPSEPLAIVPPDSFMG